MLSKQRFRKGRPRVSRNILVFAWINGKTVSKLDGRRAGNQVQFQLDYLQG